MSENMARHTPDNKYEEKQYCQPDFFTHIKLSLNQNHASTYYKHHAAHYVTGKMGVLCENLCQWLLFFRKAPLALSFGSFLFLHFNPRETQTTGSGTA